MSLTSENSIDVFEDVTGIGLNELFSSSDSVKQRARDAVWTCDFGLLADRMEEAAKQRPPVSYPAGHLVPHLYDSSLYHNHGLLTGPQPLEVGASVGDIFSNLIYAHGIETADPLLEAVLFYPVDTEWLGRQAVARAVSTWYHIRDLVDAQIVHMVPSADEIEAPNWEVIASQLGSIRAVRKAFVEVDPQLMQLARKRQRGAVNGRIRSADLVGPGNETMFRQNIRIDAFRRAISESGIDSGVLWMYLTDLDRFYSESSGSLGDLWLPSANHLKLLHAMTGTDRPVKRPEVQSELMILQAVEFPSVDGIDVKNLKAIRRSSETFEGWRTGLAAALKHFERAISLGQDTDTAKREALEMLESSAQQLLEDTSRRANSIWKAATRGLTLGVLGASPGVIAQAGANLAVVGSGAAAGLLANLLWGRIEQRADYSASRAVMKHLVALSGSEVEGAP